MSLFENPDRRACLVAYLGDSEDGAIFFQEALLRTGVPIRVMPFFSPQKAISWLQTDHGADIPAPAVFLCEYDGSTDGPEIVRHVRAAPLCTATSMVIVSSSAEETLVAQCYRAGANHFLQKPVSMDRMDIFVGTLYRCVMLADFGELTRLPEYRLWHAA